MLYMYIVCTYVLPTHNTILYYGRIHLVHLRIHKYFTDNSSINFHDKGFLDFLKKFDKKIKKNLVMEIYG